MKVIVTGAAGFIGYSTAERLLARGDSVIGIDCVNDYYDVMLKEARVARLKELGGERFTFLRQDFACVRLVHERYDRRNYDRNTEFAQHIMGCGVGFKTCGDID